MKKGKFQSKRDIDDLESYQQFRLRVPKQLSLLCKLFNMTPEDLIGDFLDDLSCGTFKSAGREIARTHLVNYFLENKYGAEQFSKDQIVTIFQEMSAVGSLFPVGADEQFRRMHLQWRDAYWKYWNDKWSSQKDRTDKHTLKQKQTR